MRYCETDAKGERLRLLKKIETATTRAEKAEADNIETRKLFEDLLLSRKQPPAGTEGWARVDWWREQYDAILNRKAGDK